MHGLPVGVTWTHLGETALKGSQIITLKEPVYWPNGSQIVIATTGDKFSPGQSEAKIIIGKSIDNKTLTLDSKLQFDHLSVKRTVGTNANKTQDIYVMAEVGLLSRNVLFQGYSDKTWAPLLSAPACPDGYDPDEFAVQTCFLGRYGPELGTDQIGAHIMISGQMRQPGQPESVIARFSNIELFHVGQAFRLGRYPIHFHMNGDMPSSYVSECAIHKSFNRATNIHASNYLLIERNVIYNIMGGAYFLEDGVEIGNVYKYNLAILVIPSSSSINEDITPAAFWATNPNNTYIHNAVAGCSHFGWWYRLLANSEGPSYSSTYCPRNIPFGIFYNNSVHSTGRFGLWIFPGYTPTLSGSCLDTRPSVAKFYNFTSYSNDRGAEFVLSNFVQFRNFSIWDQYSSGIVTKTLVFNEYPYIASPSLVASTVMPDMIAHTLYNETICPLIADSFIIGNSTPDVQFNWKGCNGLVVAWNRGQLIKNVAFYEFPAPYTQAIRAADLIGM
jgi:hypothetical protein